MYPLRYPFTPRRNHPPHYDFLRLPTTSYDFLRLPTTSYDLVVVITPKRKCVMHFLFIMMIPILVQMQMAFHDLFDGMGFCKADTFGAGQDTFFDLEHISE
ncbi:uncharacterized protein BX664DRAFT_382739 [Halteromyces radiatus]|uniref:uncharacterized protein n=1 Tax=Halteromyces radiatus TaxID=101107 RepID=UPI002220C87D|nr:uncharacterized protein BX664DRAFT_382739 [Halteromyces radiatus]KAI8096264.1 hypothetical protein BX664DRAFT_382739 [Halteromyces radiatus]